MYAGHTLHPNDRTGSGITVKTVNLGLAWLTVASSSVVFAEPAPYDVLMLALIFLLPLTGMTTFSGGVFLLLIAWLTTGAAGLAASAQSGALDVSTRHMAISIFLSMTAILISVFVQRDPERHARIIASALICASLIAVATGIAGYFSLVPGANELFTKFDRARGVFKDPNVYGSFIVPAIVYYLHGMATSPAARSFTKACLAALLCIGLLLSFSRGAWLNAAVALTVYGYVLFIASRTNMLRLKLVLIAAVGGCAAILGLLAIMQIESIAQLVNERASLIMSYDIGPEGRFGGQLKALELIAANPLGIGALEFSRSHHVEDVHNVYLSMFLNAGWVGGFIYLGLVAATLAAGLRASLRPGPTQGIAIVMLASFAGLAVEGAVVDSDHWRHFYIVMGMLWGLILAKQTAQPSRGD